MKSFITAFFHAVLFGAVIPGAGVLFSVPSGGGGTLSPLEASKLDRSLRSELKTLTEVFLLLTFEGVKPLDRIVGHERRSGIRS